MLSGSLLGVLLKDIRSVPVGYMPVRQIHPLDFEEFLWAVGLGEAVIQTVRKAWEERQRVDETIHSKLLKLFRLYVVVGGMPAVVQRFLDEGQSLALSVDLESMLP